MKNKKYWDFKALSKNQAELYIYGEITSYKWGIADVTANDFKNDLDNLGDINTLNLYINSPGGSVFEAQAIYTILKRHKASINVYIDGVAASAASIIAMAGDKVIMPKNAMIMIHNAWMYTAGNSSELRKIADDLDKTNQSMLEVYKNKTGLDEEKLKEMMDAETWLTASEAYELGFAEEIEEEKQIVASIKDFEILNKYRNTPKFIAITKVKETIEKTDNISDKKIKEIENSIKETEIFIALNK